MTRTRWIAAILLLLVAVLAHLGWWYLPRERASRPSADLALPVLDDGRYDLRLWNP